MIGKIEKQNQSLVLGIGIMGNKYSTRINGVLLKEYDAWHGMLRRCFDVKKKKKQPAYKDIMCCEEWLNYENFYEWLHSQKNFDKWYNGKRWALDKDILFKGNKIYSPTTCCLVPQNVNNLFLKRNSTRGDLPIGVFRHGNGYQSCCKNPFNNKTEHLGTYYDINSAFQAYKKAKESYIKQVAQEEYNKGNIIKRCYEAMINYQVEITD